MAEETRYDEELGPLLNQQEAAVFLATSEHTLEYWRRENINQGPPFIRVCSNIRYPAKWLNTWLLKNAHCPEGGCPKGDGQ